MTNEFNKTIDVWIRAIQQYTFEQLLIQPGRNKWSLGQVCVHLLNDTNWFFEQIKICISNDDNTNENMSSFAKIIISNNSFPVEKLTNPANANMPQPQNKEILLQSFIKLKKDINAVVMQIINSTFNGKTKHPGFNYFNANECCNLLKCIYGII